MPGTRNRVQKAIDAECVRLIGNLSKSKSKIQPGDEVELRYSEIAAIELIPEPIRLEIVYEDEHLVWSISNAGWLFSSIGHRKRNAYHALLYHLDCETQ
jgi:23S rRNA pseudouridine1911/1915/1917 synthase